VAQRATDALTLTEWCIPLCHVVSRCYCPLLSCVASSMFVVWKSGIAQFECVCWIFAS
jgi:hypothetical protein